MKRIWALLPVVLSLSLGTGAAFQFWTPQSPSIPEADPMVLELSELQDSLGHLERDMGRFRENLDGMDRYLERQKELYRLQRESLQDLTQSARAYREASDGIYEQKIIALLGEAVGFARSSHSTVMVFDFFKIDYRGYVAKVTPHAPQAIEVSAAPDGTRQNVSQAARRHDAVLAINGGGFYSAQKNGRTVYRHLGNTMVDGALLGEFVPTYKDLAFTGFTRDGELVGGLFDTQSELLATEVWAGVTFVPQLIRDGKKSPVPDRWAQTRQPRTIVGEYPNGDILLIVIDGRQSEWSNGVTLEEAQDVLLRLGIREAYNLDGGGSTTMVFDGEVINKPSDGEERPVMSQIIVH